MQRKNRQIIQLDNENFLKEIVNLLSEGHTATILLRGRSMRPFLEDRRDRAKLKLAQNPQVGEAVLAEISEGHYVLHRIIDINGQEVTLRGDGNIGVEHCRLEDVKAQVVGFYRKGRTKMDRTDGIKWRIYSWVWTRLYPIRRYLLFALHPHIPHRFKK